LFAKKTRLKIRTFHRWIGPIIGVQLSIWVVTGVYFAWISIGSIKGDDKKVKVDPSPISLGELISPKDLAIPPGFLVKVVKLESTPMGVVYRVDALTEEVLVFDARTGTALPHLTLESARSLGKAQVTIQSQVLEGALVTEKGGEYKGPVPAYRIVFDDLLSTRLYLDPWTGKLIVQRNLLWRVYDFMWMLHIMDYTERENFNNIWIKAVSLGGLSIIVTGYLLFLFGRFNRRRT